MKEKFVWVMIMGVERKWTSKEIKLRKKLLVEKNYLYIKGIEKIF